MAKQDILSTRGEIITTVDLVECDWSWPLPYKTKLGLSVQAALSGGASLSRAALCYADLSGADLRGANLRYADLGVADLRRANLSGADLRRVDLRGADLRRANLSEADLSEADLRRADLREADLFGARMDEKTERRVRDKLSVLPEGDIIGWKISTEGHLIKLLIPKEARRYNSTGRKCRAEYARVLEIEGKQETSTYQFGPTTVYKVGELVYPDKWDDDWKNKCSHGIHFFITRTEAEEHREG